MQSQDILGLKSIFQSNTLPVYRQSEVSECGLACLAMISSYYGNKVNMAEMRAKFNVGINGCTSKMLVDYASYINLSSRVIKVSLEDLKKLRSPSILHWDFNHFVVLKSIDKRKAVLHDPKVGKISIGIKELSRHYTGVAIELIPTEYFTKKKEPHKLGLSDLWNRIFGLKRNLAMMLFLTLFSQVMILLSPYYIQLVIDGVIPNNSLELLGMLSIGFIALLVIEVLSSYFRELFAISFVRDLQFQLSTNLFSHLIRLPISFFDKRHIGDVISRFSSLNKVKNFIGESIVDGFIDLIVLLGVLFVLSMYDIYLTLIVVIATLVFFMVRLSFFSPFREASQKEILALAEENTNFIETVKGIQAIKLSSSEGARSSLWSNHYVEYLNNSIKVGTYNATFKMSYRLIFGIENIAVIYLGVHGVLDNTFSIGMLFAFLSYKSILVTKAQNVVDLYIKFRVLTIHLNRLSDIVFSEAEAQSSDGHSFDSVSRKIEGNLEIRDLSFSYADFSDNVLDSVSISVSSGEYVAITGPSGSGKSTLIKIMTGLIEPKSGSVVVDSVQLKDWDIKSYRSQIGTVMQNDEILSGTIIDNITFFCDYPDMDLVINCSKMAAIHDDITKLPMGYNSFVGDMGSSLSGGQKQRVLLARALYKRPRILFLDEATSHLDVKNEIQINDAVKNLNITRVIIAHRSETLKSADRIINLDSINGAAV